MEDKKMNIRIVKPLLLLFCLCLTLTALADQLITVVPANGYQSAKMIDEINGFLAGPYQVAPTIMLTLPITTIPVSPNFVNQAHGGCIPQYAIDFPDVNPPNARLDNGYMWTFAHELRELLPCSQRMAIKEVNETSLGSTYSAAIQETIANSGTDSLFWKAGQQIPGFSGTTSIFTTWASQNVPRNSVGGENNWYSQWLPSGLSGMLQLLANDDYRQMDNQLNAAIQPGGQLDPAKGPYPVGNFLAIFDQVFPTLNGRTASETFGASPQMYFNGPDGTYLQFDWSYNAQADIMPDYNPIKYSNTAFVSTPVMNDWGPNVTIQVKQRKNGDSTLLTNIPVWVVVKDWNGQMVTGLEIATGAG